MTKFIVRIPTRVKNLELKKKTLSTEVKDRGKPDAVIKATVVSVGWFVHFDGSYESLFVGDEKPRGLEIGDEVDILIVPRKEVLTGT